LAIAKCQEARRAGGVKGGGAAERSEGTLVTPPSTVVCWTSDGRPATTREQIREAIENPSPDATFEDAIERLVFLAKIEAGVAALDAGKGIPHDEVKRRLGL
jgi:predicted transcriptional regulator